MNNAGLPTESVWVSPSCVVVDVPNESVFDASSLYCGHAFVRDVVLHAARTDEKTAIVHGRVRFVVEKPDAASGCDCAFESIECGVSMHFDKLEGVEANGWVARSMHFARVIPSAPPRVSLGDGVRSLSVDPARILFVESAGKRQVVHFEEGATRETYAPLYELERRLPDSFMRIHRCYIVNKAHVRSMSRKGIELDDGSVLPVAARRYMETRSALFGEAGREG